MKKSLKLTLSTALAVVSINSACASGAENGFDKFKNFFKPQQIVTEHQIEGPVHLQGNNILVNNIPLTVKAQIIVENAGKMINDSRLTFKQGDRPTSGDALSGGLIIESERNNETIIFDVNNNYTLVSDEILLNLKTKSAKIDAILTAAKGQITKLQTIAIPNYDAGNISEFIKLNSVNSLNVTDTSSSNPAGFVQAVKDAINNKATALTDSITNLSYNAGNISKFISLNTKNSLSIDEGLVNSDPAGFATAVKDAINNKATALTSSITNLSYEPGNIQTFIGLNKSNSLSIDEDLVNSDPAGFVQAVKDAITSKATALTDSITNLSYEAGNIQTFKDLNTANSLSIDEDLVNSDPAKFAQAVKDAINNKATALTSSIKDLSYDAGNIQTFINLNTTNSLNVPDTSFSDPSGFATAILTAINNKATALTDSITDLSYDAGNIQTFIGLNTTNNLNVTDTSSSNPAEFAAAILTAINNKATALTGSITDLSYDAGNISKFINLNTTNSLNVSDTSSSNPAGFVQAVKDAITSKATALTDSIKDLNYNAGNIQIFKDLNKDNTLLVTIDPISDPAGFVQAVKDAIPEKIQKLNELSSAAKIKSSAIFKNKMNGEFDLKQAGKNSIFEGMAAGGHYMLKAGELEPDLSQFSVIANKELCEHKKPFSQHQSYMFPKVSYDYAADISKEIVTANVDEIQNVMTLKTTGTDKIVTKQDVINKFKYFAVAPCDTQLDRAVQLSNSGVESDNRPANLAELTADQKLNLESSTFYVDPSKNLGKIFKGDKKYDELDNQIIPADSKFRIKSDKTDIIMGKTQENVVKLTDARIGQVKDTVKVMVEQNTQTIQIENNTKTADQYLSINLDTYNSRLANVNIAKGDVELKGEAIYGGLSTALGTKTKISGKIIIGKMMEHKEKKVDMKLFFENLFDVRGSESSSSSEE